MNAYTGSTTVSNGTLLVNGSLAAASAVYVQGGTLGGRGSINGPVTVVSGATMKPGLGGPDTTDLNVNSNVSLAGATIIGINRTNASISARLVVAGTLTNGGTLTVTNVGPAVQAGDSFTLFTLSAPSVGSFSATNLPPLGTGTNWWPTTVNTTNVAILVNRAPAAGAASYNRTSGESLKIAITNLMTYVTDADGNTPMFVGVSSTTNGATLLTDADYIYVPTNNVADQFTYMVTDGFGGTNSGVVALVISNSVTGTSSISGVITGNPTTLTAYGIAGETYITQRATNLDQVAWEDIATNALTGTNVVISVTDSNPPASTAFYRLKWQQP